MWKSVHRRHWRFSIADFYTIFYCFLHYFVLFSALFFDIAIATVIFSSCFRCCCWFWLSSTAAAATKILVIFLLLCCCCSSPIELTFDLTFDRLLGPTYYIPNWSLIWTFLWFPRPLLLLLLLFEILTSVLLMEKFEIILIHFDGKDYTSWAFQFQIYLEGKELWGYMDGFEPKPEDDDKKIPCMKKNLVTRLCWTPFYSQSETTQIFLWDVGLS